MTELLALSWLRRRPEVGGTPAPEPREIGVVPVSTGLLLEVLDASGARMVRIESAGERVTDLVNGHETLSVRETQENEAGVEIVEELDLENVLVVFPPPQATDQRHRLHRPAHPVRIVVGPYEVVGDAHIPPGAQAVGFLLRNRPRFVPLTGASLRLTENPGSSRRVPVAIVNLGRADLLREATAEDV